MPIAADNKRTRQAGGRGSAWRPANDFSVMSLTMKSTPTTAACRCCCTDAEKSGHEAGDATDEDGQQAHGKPRLSSIAPRFMPAAILTNSSRFRDNSETSFR